MKNVLSNKKVIQMLMFAMQKKIGRITINKYSIISFQFK